MAQTIPPVLAFDSLDSTNAEARRRVQGGDTGPVWITAAVQTAGRGRRGRSWSTQPGNLAATLLTQTRRPPAEAAQVSFVTALAVADLAANYVGPDRVRLKWPNDVLVAGLKVAGILIESGPAPSGGLWLAVGVGVNLESAPQDTERPAGAIVDFMQSAAPPPAEAMTTLAQAFAEWFERWETEGFEPIRAAWTARAQGLGELCQARLETETVEGVAEGLGPDGALLLRLATGNIRSIAAGDVFFGGAA
jgi:BirA family transcriptional regulator, biotin operon repressor / biotin---[acetyl-CoA-carboxylase] ligase